MKKLLGIVLLSLLLCNVGFAGLLPGPKPSFQFTEDDKIKESKEGESIIDKSKKSTDIKNNKYWNSPLTKFDYVLMQFKMAADAETEKILKKKKEVYFYFDRFERIKKYWELFGRYKDFDVTNSVYFDEDSGKIVVSFNIDGVGKAKEPMSKFCKRFIKYDLMFMPPQKMRGYTYHNRILNELYRGDDYKNYNDYLEKIANNLIYVLSVTSEVPTSKTKSDKNVFNMTCWKLNNEENYILRKWSYSLKEN